jgi:hypothetical protein
MLSDAYRQGNAVLALHFFSLNPSAQLECYKRARNLYSIPDFFPKDGSDHVDSSYFIGVACVYVTYKSEIYDLIHVDDAESVDDFDFHIQWMMHSAECKGWAGNAILSDVAWEKLRAYAKGLIAFIGMTISIEYPVFDLESLINVSEFTTSDEARRLLE